MVIRVAINGYGTIGNRVADAVALQDDMKVIHVTNTKPTCEAKMTIDKGIDIFPAVPEIVPQFQSAGIKVALTLNDLLKKLYLLVDCTPSGKGPQNLEIFKKAGVKSLFQCGVERVYGPI